MRLPKGCKLPAGAVVSPKARVSQRGKATGRSKYRAKRTTVDGITFASQKEAKRYSELKAMEAAGQISQLALQPRFRLEVQGVKVADYVADFRYVDDDDRAVVEDVKGFRTPIYRLKKKMVEAIYRIKITEV